MFMYAYMFSFSRLPHLFVFSVLTVFKDASSLFLYFTFCFFWRLQKKVFLRGILIKEEKRMV